MQYLKEFCPFLIFAPSLWKPNQITIKLIYLFKSAFFLFLYIRKKYKQKNIFKIYKKIYLLTKNTNE